MEFAGSSLWNSSSLTIPSSSSGLDRYGASPLTPAQGFNSATASSLVFIDAGVQDTSSLLGSIAGNAAVYFLNPYQDAIGQITATLLQHTGVESVHILSHGSAGRLQLGNAWLGEENLAAYTQQLKSWSQALTADADVLLYGCDVGQGAIGRSFLQDLAQFTGADVAASDDLTGIDGDWLLEAQVGNITAAGLQPADYRYNLNTQLLSEIQATLSSASVGGSISPGMVSQNGQYVVFTSKSDGLVAQDSNGFEDVFLYDRINNTYTLVSHNATNTNSGNGTSLKPVISGDGNYVAFVSSASDLVSGVTDNNNLEDIFLWERSTGNITLLSSVGGVTQGGSSTNPVINQDGSVVAFTSTAPGLLGVTDRNGIIGSDVFVWTKTNGLELVSINQNFNGSGNGSSFNPVVSADGQYVAFISTANDLIPGDNDGSQADVFVYGITTGSFDQISLNPAVAGSGSGTASGRLAISANGGRVAFATSSRLLATDTNSSNDIYVWDRATGNFILGSVSATGTQAGDNSSDAPVLSANGQYLAFISLASNLVASGDTNDALDVYWRDLDSATPSRLISQVGGVAGNSSSLSPVMSDDGKTIVFASSATNLIANDTNNRADAFAYNIDTLVLSLVSRQQGVTTPTVGDSGTQNLAISGDGKFVFFSSDATNLVPQDTNGVEDVFFTDLTTGAVNLVSRATRASVTGNGNSDVTANQSISADGRYVVFTSSVDNLVSGDTNGVTDIFLRDVTLPSSDPNAIKLVSRTTSGNAGNGNSSTPMISGDGNFIVFTSSASDLDAGDTNNQADIFLYNRSTGTVQLISKVGATLANGASANPVISNDGQYVVFTSTASNLVANDNNNAQDVFLWNRSTGTIQLVSKTGPGNSGNAASTNAIISANGQYVVFTSTASDLVSGDTNGVQDIFAFNTQTGSVTLLSTGSGGISNGTSSSPVISDDGRYVAFVSDGANLVTNDTNGTQDVFRYDLQAASNPLTLVSVNTSGNAGVTTGTPITLGSYAPTISADGNFIAFVSTASDLTTTTDTNGNTPDVFVRNMQTGQTALVSVNSADTGSGNGSGSLNPVISADGRYIAFESTASDLVTGDTNGNIQDVFVRDTVTGRTRLISVDELDTQSGNAASNDPTLSRNAAYIAFTSDASNLVADDLNRAADVFGTELKQTVSIVTQDGTATETAGDTGAYKVSRTDPAGELIIKLNPKVTGTASLQDYDITTTTVGATLVRDSNTGLVTLTLADNVKEAVLIVTAIDDVPAEATETVELALVDDGGFLISSAAPSATVSITDNDTVVTNTNDTGEGSLRQAILNANAFAGSNTITFQIPGAGPHTIALQSALPSITDTVIIDGTSQAGFTTTPIITLDGTAIVTVANGLTLTANGNQVKGLTLTNFKGDGIAIAGNNNTIGLGASDTIGSNIITSNGQAGVAVTSGTGNRISGNSIVNNTGLGIDLGADGVTSNDLGDADTGVNNLQNFPISLVAENTIAGNQTIITGRLNSIAGRTLRVEFFSNTAADASTNGEGEVYLGFQDVTIDSNGFADIAFTTTTAITGFVSATAIDTQNGDTSEFAVTVPLSKPEISIVPVVPSLTEGNTGTSGYEFDVVLSRASAQAVTVNVATQAGTATEGTDYEAFAQALTFAPGVTTQRITVNVIGDTLVETNETFNVVLSNPSVNATLATTLSATGTIRDDDTPQFSIVASAPSVTEGNSGTVAYTFTVSLSQPSLIPVSVDYRTVDGTAVSTGAGADFAAATGTLNFAANDTTPQTITILVNGDTTFEPDENFVVELLNPSGAIIDSTATTATGVIANDELAPTITLEPLTLSQNEGASGATTYEFKVKLSGPSSAPITVDYTTQDGTALATEDYTAAIGTLTFAPGELEKTVTVQVAGDTKFETDETFTLVLSNPTGSATIAPGNTTATGTVTNDDLRPTISFVSSTVANPEGNTGNIPKTFTVQLSNPSSEVVTVNYTTQDGTAIAGSDYTASTGTLTFNPGETSKDITIQVAGDTTPEENEDFQIQLTGATNATFTGSATELLATGTITDDDTTAKISLVPLTLSLAEGNSGTTDYTFKVQLSQAATQPITIDYITKDGTALAGEDYTASNGTLTFAAGETEKTITIQVNGDTQFEGDETFTLELSNPTGGATITAGNEIGTATITNDDSRPTISFAAPNVSTVEGNSGNTPAVFTINLSNPSSEVVTVTYTTQDSTATAGSDYTTATGTLTFNPGETSKDITVQIAGDTTPESNETYQVQLSGANNATFAGGAATLSSTGTITDDDIAITLSPLTISQTEGNSGTVDYTFTVKLSQAATQPITIDYATTDGTALAGEDYTAANGQLTFAAGEIEKTITVKVNGDTKFEGDETFTLELANAIGATITAGNEIGTATITNDDSRPSISFAAPNVSATEGNSGNTPATFTINLSNPSNEVITVNYATQDATATAGSDYTAVTGTLTFNPGETSKDITVQVTGDTTPESNETFQVQLSGANNATFAGGASTLSSTGTITDDDTAITLVPLTISQTEGNSATTDYVFKVQLSKPATQAITVDYTTKDGTALAGEDYTAANGQLTFAVGETEKTITIKANGDTKFEGDETFTLELANAVGATITAGNEIGTATITNDDSRPSISFAAPNVSTTEGNSGNTPATFTVNLSNPSNEVVTVNYATQNGTATAGSDYTATTGTLTFNPGETSKTITVQVTGDTTAESNETYQVQLSSANNATFAGGVTTLSSTGTITDDDAPVVPKISVTPSLVSKTEGNSNSQFYQFTIQLDQPTTQQVSVQYATVDGTAVSSGLSADYGGKSGTLIFAAGETSKTVTIEVFGDTNFEANETFKVQLTNPLNALLETAEATGEILNDDAAPLPSISVIATPDTVVEGNAGTTKTVTFTVSLSNAATQPVTVTYATVDGSATSAGNDYVPVSGSLTFAPGETSKTVDVTVRGDNTVEADEDFSLNLSNPTNAKIDVLSAFATISNDDSNNGQLPTVSLGTGNVSLPEGNTLGSVIPFTITLSQPATQTITVRVDTVDGTAIAGQDYVPISNGVITFNPGEQSKTFTVSTISDTTPEPDETFDVRLSSPSNAVLGTLSQTAVITNDDGAVLPTVSLGSTAITQNEGNSGTTTYTFTATLSQAATSAITVDYDTIDATATVADNDYVAVSNGRLTFNAGETTKTFSITVNGDTKVEPNETFKVQLKNPVGATIGTASQDGIIQNDDVAPSPSLSIVPTNAAQTEGNSGTKAFTFTVNLSQAATIPVTVNYATADGTATVANNDYIQKSGTLTFSAGETSKIITIDVNGDTVVEADESFSVQLSNASGAAISTASANATIVNDDILALPNISIAPTTLSQAEGNLGNRAYDFTVTLSQASTQAVTVNYAIQDGTATLADGDYVVSSPTGTLNFAPGEISKVITVNVVGDNKFEADETFTVRLSSPSNGILNNSAIIATGTIVNDDAAGMATNLSLDGNADLFWRNTNTGDVVFWQTNRTPSVNQYNLNKSISDPNWQIQGTADFDGDGDADILWHNNVTGASLIWRMDGVNYGEDVILPTVSDTNWKIEGIGDFTGDGRPDILWRQTKVGSVQVWAMNGTTPTNSYSIFTIGNGDWVVEKVGDLNGDNVSDVVWRNQRTGLMTDWLISANANGIRFQSVDLLSVPDLSWKIEGIADFNSDRQSDILWRNYRTGENNIWIMNNGRYISSTRLLNVPESSWVIKGISDFNKDGSTDILWQNQQTQEVSLWYMNRGTYGSSLSLPNAPSGWLMSAVNDFGTDRNADVLWRDTKTGATYIWTIDSSTFNQTINVGRIDDLSWKAELTGDFNGDGKVDIFWRNQRTGSNIFWIMNNTQFVTSTFKIPQVPDLSWKVQGASDFDGDGDLDILWQNRSTGQVLIWEMDRDRYIRDRILMTVPDLSWQIEGIADFDLDQKPDILWRNYRTGQTDIWRMNGFSYRQSFSLPLVSDITWRIEGIDDFNKDGRVDILWSNPLTRDVDIWTMNNFTFSQSYRVNKMPSGNWQIQGIRDFNSDGTLDIFWVNPTTGSTQVWYMAGVNYGSAISLPTYSDLNWRIEGLDDFGSGTPA